MEVERFDKLSEPFQLVFQFLTCLSFEPSCQTVQVSKHIARWTFYNAVWFTQREFTEQKNSVAEFPDVDDAGPPDLAGIDLADVPLRDEPCYCSPDCEPSCVDDSWLLRRSHCGM